MTNKPKDRLAVLKDVAELLSTCGKWGAFFIGGFCMLLYTNEIEQFPEGLQLGEGLAFYLVSAGFFFAYAFYTVGLTAFGCILLRWPAHWLRNGGITWRRRKNSAKTASSRLDTDLPTDFASMPAVPARAALANVPRAAAGSWQTKSNE